ncbi:MAG: nickel pincer cofactor biosynthesis protein LarB [Armatimonadetes bacterium]|nr:nickel pincer cofactor biosynthesis protein LarB [Armatimonadota bacterium]
MTQEQLLQMLEAVRSGMMPIDAAAQQLQGMEPAVDVEEFGKVDTDRVRRRGFPEAMLCQWKTPEEILAIARALFQHHGLALGTRCSPEAAAVVLAALPGEYHPIARTIRIGQPMPIWFPGRVAVVAAGTSDRPVAEEACITLETFGAAVDRIYDVGVAGLHRLLGQQQRIAEATVLIVVAGMEGALPSVVGGMFPQPLIAVPVSVGYGAALGGFTPLMAMLTSCAGGITVVNIDNGFGAGLAALTILQAIQRGASGAADSVER